MKKRLLPLAFILLFFATSVSSVVLHPSLARQAFVTIPYFDLFGPALEEFFQQAIPFQDFLGDLSRQLRIIGGQKEFDNIILTEEGLVKNLVPSADTGIHKANTKAIRKFAQTCNIPTHLMLVPTSCAIYQEQLPGRLELYNQKRYIEETYRSLSGTVTTVDVYPALYNTRNDYLYYRSDSVLTSLGGYTVYQTLSKRLRLTPYQEYTMTRASYDYYGELHRQWGHSGVKPDLITLYHNTSVKRSYRVYHWDRYENRTYYTLFPQSSTVSGSDLDVILGGHSPKIEITAIGAPSQRLLVFGDRGTLSYLSFLAPHYSQITYIDLSLMTQWEIEELSLDGYDQVLFSYDLESYLNTVAPSRVSSISIPDALSVK